MRHYMIDPDNEERLLKVPPRVVQGIKNEAYKELLDLIRAQRENEIEFSGEWYALTWTMEVIMEKGFDNGVS